VRGVPSNMDFRVTKGVLDEDIIARGEMEDNRDDYTSNSTYATLAKSKFPNLERDVLALYNSEKRRQRRRTYSDDIASVCSEPF